MTDSEQDKLVLRESRCRVLQHKGVSYIRADDLIAWLSGSTFANQNEVARQLLRMLQEEIEKVAA